MQTQAKESTDASPAGFWYDQARPEWVVLLAGAARLRFEDGEVELRPGDHVAVVGAVAYTLFGPPRTEAVDSPLPIRQG